MGFRNDAYATVWKVEPISDTMTKCRISISRKDKNTGQYVQSFSGFVAFVGTATAKKAACLHERDRIRLGDVDVTSKYDEAKRITYYNFTVFSFDQVDGPAGGGNSYREPSVAPPPAPSPDDGSYAESRLPF